MKGRFIFICVLSVFVAVVWMACQGENGLDPASQAPGVTAPDVALQAKAYTDGVSAGFNVQAHATVQAETGGCSNNPGPYITLTGEIALGGVDAKLIFSNNRKFTHTHEEDVVASVVLLPAGETIKFAKQPPLGGAGGNPWIYLVFTDGDGNYYSDPMLLGRCVQGLFATSLDLGIPSNASAHVTTGGCSNSPGPYITLDGELAIGGLNAQLIFTNNKKFTHVHKEDIVVDIVILPAGETIRFNKQPPLDGAGGNPHIFLQFCDGDGYGLSDLFYLGRCVQLSK
jgi:hypothetical protein